MVSTLLIMVFRKIVKNPSYIKGKMIVWVTSRSLMRARQNSMNRLTHQTSRFGIVYHQLLDVWGFSFSRTKLNKGSETSYMSVKEINICFICSKIFNKTETKCNFKIAFEQNFEKLYLNLYQLAKINP